MKNITDFIRVPLWSILLVMILAIILGIAPIVHDKNNICIPSSIAEEKIKYKLYKVNHNYMDIDTIIGATKYNIVATTDEGMRLAFIDENNDNVVANYVNVKSVKEIRIPQLMWIPFDTTQFNSSVIPAT